MSSDIHVMQVTVARLNPLVANRWNISYSHGKKWQNPTFRVIKIGLGTIAFGGFIIGCLKIVAARPWNHVPCYVVPRYG